MSGYQVVKVGTADDGGVDLDDLREKADELQQLTETVMEEGESLRALDRLIGRAAKALAALPSRWPVRGAVNSEFGNRLSPWTLTREFHSGIDIGAKAGTSVHAPAAGSVVFAGNHGEFGIAVILDHGDEIRTVYGHLSKAVVSVGQKVERGTLLGYTGNTGRSSGPHLHYEILVKGRAVNPRGYLWN
jgi:murein DD-endopeptidase MepM/ murein hydrolase activator NlpD